MVFTRSARNKISPPRRTLKVLIDRAGEHVEKRGKSQITSTKSRISTKSQAPNNKQGPNGKTANSKQTAKAA
jgi:hypothetical protein